MHKKTYLYTFATVLWLALSAFYSGPIEGSSRGGPASPGNLSEIYPIPPPGPCDPDAITLSTDNGDFPTGQMTQWTVPAGITEVTILAKGGNGGFFGGVGAQANATLPVTPGDVLHVIVSGAVASGGLGGGGGTGVYNFTTGEVLIVAGGGGGSVGGQGGLATADGGNNGGSAASGGTNGDGGGSSHAGGGGGAFSPGADVLNPSAGPGTGGGQGVPNGGNGGSPSGAFGFGGGGAGTNNGNGGGGGYSGGGSSIETNGGGGGGSFVHEDGTDVSITAGTKNSGSFAGDPGYVVLCYTPAPACPPGDVSLYSQPEVDAFVATYPNCTEIAGRLLLGGGIPNPTTDISGLSALTSIAGDLVIGGNALTSLDGLDNLATIGGEMFIAQNDLLSNIDALSNLTSVSGPIEIIFNTSLTNLNGLSNLNSVGGLAIVFLPSLTSLAGLENITSYGQGLFLAQNSALASLDGLNDAATFGFILIADNPLLSACDAPAICNHLAAGGSADISGNAAGCGSIAEVEAACFPCDIAVNNIAPTAESCPGANDGSIAVSAACTTCSGIEYSIDGVNFQATSTFSGLAPGNYTVTVRDTGDPGCEATDDATVNAGPATDTDNDGTADCNDGCPDDPGKIAPGTCGCGIADTDTDNDGTADCNDGCPDDPGKIAPGACGCGIADTDTDNDGTADCNDECPNDPNKFEVGICGCGVPETSCIDACAVFNGLVSSVMEDDTDLKNGQQNALVTKLHHAKLNFEQGDNNTAINQLNAFINQVQALSDGNNKPIPSAIAADWIAAAQSIIDNINTGTALCIQARVADSNRAEAVRMDQTVLPDPVSRQARTGPARTREADAGNSSLDFETVLPAGQMSRLESSPNPFTGQVALLYHLPQDGHVQLSILSLHGQLISELVNSRQSAGPQRVEWTAATGLPAGVYFARLRTQSGVSTLQLVLTR